MAITDWDDNDIKSEDVVQMMRDLNRLEYLCELQQTEWFRYDDGELPVSLGTPDGGVSVPSLNALGDQYYRVQYIVAIREAIEAVCAADQLHDFSDWRRFVFGATSISKPSPRYKSLYALAAPKDECRCGKDDTTDQQRYTWFVSSANMLANVETSFSSDEVNPVFVSTEFYAFHMSEIYECVKLLKAAVLAYHVTIDGEGEGTSWDDPASIYDINDWVEDLSAYGTDVPVVFAQGGQYTLTENLNIAASIRGGFDGEDRLVDRNVANDKTEFDGGGDKYVKLAFADYCSVTGCRRAYIETADNCRVHHNTWDWFNDAAYPVDGWEFDNFTYLGILLPVNPAAGLLCKTITNSEVDYNELRFTRPDRYYKKTSLPFLIYTFGAYPCPLVIGGCQAAIVQGCNFHHNYCTGTLSSDVLTAGPNGADGADGTAGGTYEEACGKDGQGGKYAYDFDGQLYWANENTGRAGCHAVAGVVISGSVGGVRKLEDTTFQSNTAIAISGTSGLDGGDGGEGGDGKISANGTHGMPGRGGNAGAGGDGGIGGSCAVALLPYGIIDVDCSYVGNSCVKGSHGAGGDGGKPGLGGLYPQPSTATRNYPGIIARGGIGSPPGVNDLGEPTYELDAPIESTVAYISPQNPYQNAFASVIELYPKS